MSGHMDNGFIFSSSFKYCIRIQGTKEQNFMCYNFKKRAIFFYVLLPRILIFLPCIDSLIHYPYYSRLDYCILYTLEHTQSQIEFYQTIIPSCRPGLPGLAFVASCDRLLRRLLDKTNLLAPCVACVLFSSHLISYIWLLGSLSLSFACDRLSLVVTEPPLSIIMLLCGRFLRAPPRSVLVSIPRLVSQ